MTIARPDRSECAEYYFLYIDQVPNEAVLELLAEQHRSTPKFLRSLATERLDYRYAPGKWNPREILGHVIDVERAFSYRAFSFARREPADLPSFEQDPYIENSRYGGRDLPGILAEYDAVRVATLALFDTFDDEEWSRTGRASGVDFTVRTIPYILAGHERHHLNVIRERY